MIASNRGGGWDVNSSTEEEEKSKAPKKEKVTVKTESSQDADDEHEESVEERKRGKELERDVKQRIRNLQDQIGSRPTQELLDETRALLKDVRTPAAALAEAELFTALCRSVREWAESCD